MFSLTKAEWERRVWPALDQRPAVVRAKGGLDRIVGVKVVILW